VNNSEHSECGTEAVSVTTRCSVNHKAKYLAGQIYITYNVVNVMSRLHKHRTLSRACIHKTTIISFVSAVAWLFLRWEVQRTNPHSLFRFAIYQKRYFGQYKLCKLGKNGRVNGLGLFQRYDYKEGGKQEILKEKLSVK
jgi:hypothetical protein